MLLDEFVMTENFLKWYNRFDNASSVPEDRKENPNDYDHEEIFKMSVNYIMDTEYLAFNRHQNRMFIYSPCNQHGEIVSLYLCRIYRDKYNNLNPDVEELIKDIGKELLLSSAVTRPQMYRT